MKTILFLLGVIVVSSLVIYGFGEFLQFLFKTNWYWVGWTIYSSLATILLLFILLFVGILFTRDPNHRS